MRLVPLSKRVARELISELSERYGMKLDRKSQVFKVKVNDTTIYVINGVPAFFRRGGKGDVIPTLIALRKGFVRLPEVIVDSGAVKPLLRGADVMIPGIRGLDDFSKGNYVGVKDEGESGYIIVGKALMNANEIRAKKRGKAIENIHRAGDIIWRLCLEIIKKYGGKALT
ncbi:MAG: RNA-binding protein [Desulfurococcales archaeon ex4484_42]|nr:MAG: RNA-binding protein [Desulfurococcales archaeon ex4484_42]